MQRKKYGIVGVADIHLMLMVMMNVLMYVLMSVMAVLKKKMVDMPAVLNNVERSNVDSYGSMALMMRIVV